MAALVLVGCASRGGAPDPATKQGNDVLQLWRIVLTAGVVLGVFVVGLILWSVVRYRRPKGTSPGTLPKQVREHIPLEIFYTAVPLVVVAVLFGLSMRTQHRVTRLSPNPDLAVDVTGFQWGWRFAYPAQGVTVVGDANNPPTLVLPVDATIRLHLVAADVIHSFFVPDFLVKKDMIPGIDNELQVQPTRLGHFGGVCAEFCGLDHTRMTFSVDVVTPQDFAAFAARAQPVPGSQGPDPGGPGEIGRQARVAR